MYSRYLRGYVPSLQNSLATREKCSDITGAGIEEINYKCMRMVSSRTIIWCEEAISNTLHHRNDYASKYLSFACDFL